MDSRILDNQCEEIENVCLASLVKNNLKRIIRPSSEDSSQNSISVLGNCDTSKGKLISSSRRKRYSGKVPCTYSEFINQQPDCEPTVVDILISKNKFALVENEMKQRKKAVLNESNGQNRKKQINESNDQIVGEKITSNNTKNIVLHNKSNAKKEINSENVKKKLSVTAKTNCKGASLLEKVNKVNKSGADKKKTASNENSVTKSTPKSLNSVKTVNKKSDKDNVPAKRIYLTRSGEKMKKKKGRKLKDKNLKVLQFLSRKKSKIQNNTSESNKSASSTSQIQKVKILKNNLKADKKINDVKKSVKRANATSLNNGNASPVLNGTACKRLKRQSFGNKSIVSVSENNVNDTLFLVDESDLRNSSSNDNKINISEALSGLCEINSAKVSTPIIPVSSGRKNTLQLSNGKKNDVGIKGNAKNDIKILDSLNVTLKDTIIEPLIVESFDLDNNNNSEDVLNTENFEIETKNTDRYSIRGDELNMTMGNFSTADSKIVDLRGETDIFVNHDKSGGKSPENQEVKESVMSALGLQSLDKVNKIRSSAGYTGTLKAVIKLHKTSDKDKGYRRMEMRPNNENLLNSELSHEEESTNVMNSAENSQLLDNQMSSTLGSRFIDYDTSAVGHLGEYLSKVNVFSIKEKSKSSATSLVVPEKSSSFSIHPNRLCSDVCKYCFGKFGTLDTPCHVGHLRNPERQAKILSCEPKLKLDTCLCDACFRYVDKKANRPPVSKRKTIRRNSCSQRTVCVIQGCNQSARHLVKRKWLFKLKRKFSKLTSDLRKSGPRMSFGLCTQHFYLAEFYILCGLCKKRLDRNHVYAIGSDSHKVNDVLLKDGAPVKVADNDVLCKLCRYCISIRIACGQYSALPDGHKQHYDNFLAKLRRKHALTIEKDKTPAEVRIGEENDVSLHYELHCDEASDMILISDDESAEIPESTTKGSNSGSFRADQRKSQKNNSTKNYQVGFTNIANLLNPLENDLGVGDRRENGTRIQVKFGNLNIRKLSNLNIGQDSRTETKHTETSTSTDNELPLIANFNFEDSVASENKNWEKCTTTIQFDKNTKKLYQDLQMPYGNQSSFMRHLIMLEKYWRSGALVLAENAEPSAVKYIRSVQNRVQSLESSSSWNIKNRTELSECGLSRIRAEILEPRLSRVKNRADILEANSSRVQNHIPKIMETTTSSRQVNGRIVTNKNSLNSQMLQEKVSETGQPSLVKVSSMAPNSVFLKSVNMKTIPGLTNLKPLIPVTLASTFNQTVGKQIHINSSGMKNMIPVSLNEIKDKYSISETVKSNNNRSFGFSFLKSTSNQNNLNNPSTSMRASQRYLINGAGKLSEKSKGLPNNVATVTQMDESNNINKQDRNSIPFLAGEKPSVSVFREFIE